MNRSSRCVRALAALILSAAAIALSAQTFDTIDPALKSCIDSIAASVMKQRGVPSAFVAVVQPGKLVYTYA
jgi:D-alanyl-D-alanine carboxypeptidase